MPRCASCARGRTQPWRNTWLTSSNASAASERWFTFYKADLLSTCCQLPPTAVDDGQPTPPTTMARKVYGIKTHEEYREPTLFDLLDAHNAEAYSGGA
jgi:hypothetical protein